LDYELQFDARHRIVKLGFHNDVTEASYLAGFAALIAFFRAQEPEGAILDFSDIHEFGLSTAFVKMIADLPEITTKPRVVIAPQKVVYGMVRMFQILRELNAAGSPTLVETMDEAARFLGMESPEFTPVVEGGATAAA
jgi:hypothetical protein